MYASIDFATKKDFCLAVQQGYPIVLYSPTLGTVAVNGRETVTGPWPNRRVPILTSLKKEDEKKKRADYRKTAMWTAHVEVKDMRVVAVH